MRAHVPLICLGVLVSATPAACSGCQSATAFATSCTVAAVVDGDTFRCRDRRRIRLTGIDSPERDQRPFGEQARDALAQLVPPGTPVRLELDLSLRDQYGRVLAYAWSRGQLVNEQMMRNGWAVLYTVPPNVKYAERLRAAQNEARAKGAGLWSRGGFECLPANYRRRRCINSP